MGENEKKSRLAGIPTWALSLLTLILAFIIGAILDDAKVASSMKIIGFIFLIIIIVVACFLICTTHPKSVWHTPLILNSWVILGIIMCIFNGFVTPLSELMWPVVCLVLSVIGANLGAEIGRRRINQAK